MLVSNVRNVYILSLFFHSFQFVSQDNITFYGKLRNYSRDMFRQMTLIAFILFYIGLILRFRMASSEDNFIAARFVSLIRRFLVFIKLLIYSEWLWQLI